MDLKELREQRGQLSAEIKRMAQLIQAEDRDFSAEEQETWDRINEDYNRLRKRQDVIEREHELDAEELRNKPPRPEAEHRRDHPANNRTVQVDHNRALKAWMRSIRGEDISPQDAEQCRLAGYNCRSNEISLPLRNDWDNIRREWRSHGRIHTRAAAVGTDSAGGYLVPEGFSNELDRALLEYGGMRQAARVIRTESGNDLPWPTVDDTSNTGAILNENATVTEQDFTFGAVVFGAYKYTSKLVKVSVELLQDAAFNMVEFLGSALGERIARAQNAHFTTGSGAAQPRGFITAIIADSATQAPATENTFVADDILTLLYAVDPAYRRSASAVFMAHDTITGTIRKMRADTSTTPDSGNFLWQPGLTAGEPDRLCGYPLITNQNMDSTVADGSEVLAFGDFSKYIIRDAGAIRLRRLTERYADADQEGFVAFLRSDGDMINAGTNPIKALTL